MAEKPYPIADEAEEILISTVAEFVWPSKSRHSSPLDIVEDWYSECAKSEDELNEMQGVLLGKSLVLLKLMTIALMQERGNRRLTLRQKQKVANYLNRLYNRWQMNHYAQNKDEK